MKTNLEVLAEQVALIDAAVEAIDSALAKVCASPVVMVETLDHDPAVDSAIEVIDAQCRKRAMRLVKEASCTEHHRRTDPQA